MDSSAEPAPLVSPVRFADLTGMTRERLRAWERRYGFPAPVRRGGGPRRYRLTDVQRVVAVRRAHEEGVPIAVAIDQTAPAEATPIGDGAFRAAVERSPSPVALLSGPAPLRAEYVNAVLRGMPQAPVAGVELVAACPDLAGSHLVDVLQDHFARELPPTEVEHPAWISTSGGAEARSTVFRLPSQPGGRPLVALVGLHTATEHDALFALAAQEEELDGLRRSAGRHERWLDAIADLAAELRDEPAADASGRSLEILVRQTQAVDAGLARYAAGELVMDTSHRGTLGPGAMMVASSPDLALAIRDRQSLWLAPDAAAQLGVPAGLHASGVPVAVGGEVLGLLLLVYDELEPHDDDNGRLLAAVSAAVGFVLLRDRLADGLREVSPPRPRASG